MLTDHEAALLAAVGPHVVTLAQLRLALPRWGATEVRRVVGSLAQMGRVVRDARGRVRRAR